MRNKKLQLLLSKLNGIDEKTSEGFADFDKGVAKLKEELKNKIQVNTLEEVNNKIENFRKRIDFDPLLEAIETLKESFGENIEKLAEELEEKSEELANLSKNTGKEVSDKIPSLMNEINFLKNEIASLLGEKNRDVEDIRKAISLSEISEGALANKIRELEDKIEEGDKELSETEDELEKEIEDLKKELSDSITKNRTELMSMIASKGGGSMNRKITFGGVDYLTRYTDINYKAGGTVSFTIANNDQTKMVDVTISATGGTGGTVRVITSVSGDTTAGDNANTDYVYLVTGTTKITLPTAVGNTNLYTIKNVGTGVVTVDTTSSQTIDGELTIIMPVQYTSVDLISDTANWNVT